MNVKIARVLTPFALLAFVFGGVKANATNLVTNGGFESLPSPLPAQNWSLYNSIPGWTGINHPIEIGKGGPVYNISGDNTNVLELDSTGNATVQQTINGLSAMSYKLDFDYARRLSGMSNRPLDTADFDVLWNGNVVAQLRNLSSTAMNPYSLNVVGTAGANTLAFRGMGTNDSYGALIDNVHVAAAVPEPGSMALLGGLAAVSGLAFRRRRK